MMNIYIPVNCLGINHVMFDDMKVNQKNGDGKSRIKYWLP